MGGGASVVPMMDYRVERCMKRFMLNQKQVDKLWVLFITYDREGKFFVTMDDFFDRIIQFPRTGLTDSMFRLIDSKSDTSLTFGEFVEVICTFCCFEKMELLRYFFYILDIQKTGLVEKNEVKHFVQMIWNHDYNSNLKEALDYLDKTDDGDGTFNFKEILSLQEKYPNTFYPIYKMQIHMVQHTLGEYFWNNHKAYIVDHRERVKMEELAALKKRQKEAAAQENAVNDEMVLKRMGYVKFYCMPWLRAKERDRISKIAAIEAELDKFKGDKKNGTTEGDDETEDV